MNKLLLVLMAGSSLSLNAIADDAVDAKFQKSCSVCHTTGVLNAPKIGDKAAWAPRLKQGKATLLKNTKNGLKLMPPKGTCTNCTDEELSKLIDMVTK